MGRDRAWLLLVIPATMLAAAIPAFVEAQTATVVPTDGYDQAIGQTLVQESKLTLVTTSNNSRFDVIAGRWLSVQFAPGVPANATVTSVKVVVEHSEDYGTANRIDVVADRPRPVEQPERGRRSNAQAVQRGLLRHHDHVGRVDRGQDARHHE